MDDQPQRPWRAVTPAAVLSLLTRATRTTLTRAWLSHEIAERKEIKRCLKSDEQALECAYIGGIARYREDCGIGECKATCLHLTGPMF